MAWSLTSCLSGKPEMEYNLIVVFDREQQHVLMCRRSKEPYQGTFNFVGGKIVPGDIYHIMSYIFANRQLVV